jgi:hypothetical protein
VEYCECVLGKWVRTAACGPNYLHKVIPFPSFKQKEPQFYSGIRESRVLMVWGAEGERGASWP